MTNKQELMTGLVAVAAVPAPEEADGGFDFGVEANLDGVLAQLLDGIFEGDQQIRVPKTHEVVAQRLRREIVTGRLAVGQRLPPEEELTATFGIARTTLREALRVLESQGLIEATRRRIGRCQTITTNTIHTENCICPCSSHCADSRQFRSLQIWCTFRIVPC